MLAALALGSGHRAQLQAMLAAGWGPRLILVLAAVAVSGYQLCFFSAVRLTGVAVGTVLAIGSAPVFTGIVSRLTGGAPLTGRWLSATVAAIAGCAILVTGGKAAGVQLGGVGLALLAGLCYAVYAVTAARLISGGTSETAVMGVLFGTAAVLLAPVLAATSTGWLLTGRGLAVTAYLGVVTTVAAYLLYGRGLRTVPRAGGGDAGTGRAGGRGAAGRGRAGRAADRAGHRGTGPGRAGDRDPDGGPDAC